MPVPKESHHPKSIILVRRGEEFRDPREPELRMGDVIQLNSGSPKMLVVDLDGDGNCTGSWFDEADIAQELILPVGCFHRISPL